MNSKCVHMDLVEDDTDAIDIYKLIRTINEKEKDLYQIVLNSPKRIKLSGRVLHNSFEAMENLKPERVSVKRNFVNNCK